MNGTLLLGENVALIVNLKWIAKINNKAFLKKNPDGGQNCHKDLKGG